MPTTTSFITSVNTPSYDQVIDLYDQLFSVLGLSPTIEVIDVDATDSNLDRPTRRNFLRKAARSVGVAGGYTKKAATWTVNFFRAPETKAVALLAHWTTWTMFMVMVLLMTSSVVELVLLVTLHLYLTSIMFQSMLALS